MSQQPTIRIHGPGSAPTLIYLPGLHGDWTLVGSFRRALGERVRFVEVTYPRTLTWSLDDYAAAIETTLAENGIQNGWLLGESFGSQVVWAVAGGKRFALQGVILAGGFLRHPMPAAVRLAELLTGSIPLALVRPLLAVYARIARLRYGNSPEVLRDLAEFISRRTDVDRQAAQHRLRLIAENDPRRVARDLSAPVYAFTGILDPVVPWSSARRELTRYCPSLCEYRILWRADHTVLGTAPQAAADAVLRWIIQSAP
jgi:pimeloyl-ACP methyl ester carboxylesterase